MKLYYFVIIVMGIFIKDMYLQFDLKYGHFFLWQVKHIREKFTFFFNFFVHFVLF